MIRRKNDNKFLHRKLCFTHSSHAAITIVFLFFISKNYVSMWFKIKLGIYADIHLKGTHFF